MNLDRLLGQALAGAVLVGLWLAVTSIPSCSAKASSSILQNPPHSPL
jgi:hypothetical protein